MRAQPDKSVMQMTKEVLLPQLVAGHAVSHPGDVYLEEVDGIRQTYADTDREARAWALRLTGLGAKAGDRVLVMLPTCCAAVNVWIGLGWLRATNVPLNTDYRGAMLAYVIENSRARVMVCNRAHLDHVLELGPGRIGSLETIVVAGEGTSGLPSDERYELIGEKDAPADVTAVPLEGPEPHELSTVMYTSGTSGVSKGVMLTWANFAHHGNRMCPAELNNDDVMYSYLPLYHVGGTYWLNSIAQRRAKMVLKERFSLREFWADVGRYRCTVTFLLGAAANFILKQEPRADDAANTLRFAQVQPLPADLEGFERRFGLKAYTTYGSTEIGVATRTGEDRSNGRTCGTFFPELEVRLVDENDYDVPEGAVGELVVRPREPWIISTGYFEMPKETVGAWRNLWFHTGDALRRDADGNYYFVDRIKDSIRRRGENISSLEVERFVARFEGVLECAAVGVPSEWGEEDVKICVVAKEGASIDPAALIDFLRQEQIPRFMLPRYVAVLPELPKTITGKVQKRALRDVSVGDSQVWDRESPAHVAATVPA